ncbi:MAG: GntR family transcriptional regulator [Ruminococcus sp.]
MFTLDFSSRKPIYEQVYSNVVRLVSMGVLKPGEKLPPVRTLATQLSVNPNTVAKAYRELESDGYICSAVGRGSFISEDLTAQDAEKSIVLNNLENQIKTAISFGVTKEEITEITDRNFPKS